MSEVKAVIRRAAGLRRAGAAGATETLAQTYAAGASAADQTMTVTDADGGGIVIDASNNGSFAGATPSLLIKSNTNLAAQPSLQINGRTGGNVAIDLVNGAQTIRSVGNALSLTSDTGVSIGSTSATNQPIQASGFALSRYDDVTPAGANVTIKGSNTGGVASGNVGNVLGAGDISFLNVWANGNPVITIRCPSARNIKHNTGGTPAGFAPFLLAGGADYAVPAGGKLTVYYDNVLGAYVEQSRSA